MDQLIKRIDYSIEETEAQIDSLEQEYKTLSYGTKAFDLTLEIERLKGELKAFQETRLYIKYYLD